MSECISSLVALCRRSALGLGCGRDVSSLGWGARVQNTWAERVAGVGGRHTLGPGRQEMGRSHSPPLGPGNKRGFQETEGSGKILGGWPSEV